MQFRSLSSSISIGLGRPGANPVPYEHGDSHSIHAAGALR